MVQNKNLTQLSENKLSFIAEIANKITAKKAKRKLIRPDLKKGLPFFTLEITSLIIAMTK